MNNRLLFPHIIETHVVDHCNLNCAGCSHFSSLVSNEVYRDLEDFKRDLSGLSAIFQDIYELRLMGGEPLLHPRIGEFIKTARQIFPRANIVILTNGVLLPQMPEDFWRTCSINNIRINVSRYPIKLDIKTVREKARSHGIRIKVSNTISRFYQFVNIRGDSDPQESFSNCRAMFTTLFLRDLKLYNCAFVPHVAIFNDYFQKNIPLSPEDYIPLQENTKPEEIYDFIRKPTPMCRWCKTKRPVIQWQRTRKNETEWIGGEVNNLFHTFEINKFRAISIYHQLRQQIAMKLRGK